MDSLSLNRSKKYAHSCQISFDMTHSVLSIYTCEKNELISSGKNIHLMKT